MRAGHTHLDLRRSGQWAVVARRHYRHLSGIEVAYDCNRWSWVVSGPGMDPERYERLWVAQHRAERLGLVALPVAGVQ